MPARKPEETPKEVPRNVRFYHQVMTTPKEAQKPFNNGRFSGTDVNPMWRIQKLTEIFGPSGQGWWTEDVKYELIKNDQTGEVACFCTLSLYFIDPETGEKSAPIHGVGGNMFLQQRKSGMQLNDEAYKMAYTDALSIACKALGFAHDIYFQNDRTKYTMEDKPASSLEAVRKSVDTKMHELAENMTQDQKRELAAKTKEIIGTANYLKCDDEKKLNELLTYLKAA